MQYQQPLRQKVYALVGICSDLPIGRNVAKSAPVKNCWATAFLSEICASCICVWKKLKLTRYRKGCEIKSGHPPKTHYFKCWWNVVLELPIYISHEPLHMVYRIFACSVCACRGHFTAKLNNFKTLPTWRFAFPPTSHSLPLSMHEKE